MPHRPLAWRGIDRRLPGLLALPAAVVLLAYVRSHGTASAGRALVGAALGVALAGGLLAIAAWLRRDVALIAGLGFAVGLGALALSVADPARLSPFAALPIAEAVAVALAAGLVRARRLGLAAAAVGVGLVWVCLALAYELG